MILFNNIRVISPPHNKPSSLTDFNITASYRNFAAGATQSTYKAIMLSIEATHSKACRLVFPALTSE
jgi:hypothetical protein